MDHIRFGILTIVLQCFTTRNVISIQKREWIDALTPEGDVACFSEYMEMWIHRLRIEGLGVWLSEALQIQVNLASLDQLNLQMSACGFSLHKDPEKNFIFQVSYTGCFVQQQHGFNVLTLNLMKRMNRFGVRPHSLMMKCPVVSVLQSREQVQCDPKYIQVIRQVPSGNWDNESHWSLCLSDHFIVALEDASLIQMNIDVSGADITVQGRRKEILSPFKIMENEGEFLKLVRGHFSYSMEATCPKVTTSTDNTVLHIFKRHMGLTKRGSRHDEALTVSDVSVNQTNSFSVDETREFMILTVPTTQILQIKPCADSKQLLQPFYRVDVVLTFKETNHKMHWTMENTLPCIAGPGDTSSHVTSPPGPKTTALSTPESLTTGEWLLDGSTLPTGKLNEDDQFDETTAEFSTTNSPHTQIEGSSFNFYIDKMSKSQSGNLSSGFDNDTVTSRNATETTFFNFLHATADTVVEPHFLQSEDIDEESETSATLLPEQEFNTSENKEQQKKRRLKLVWED